MDTCRPFQSHPPHNRYLQVALPVAARVSNPGFPEPETRFFGCFLLPETRVFFQLPNPDIFKNLELLLHSNISNSDKTEVEDWRV